MKVAVLQLSYQGLSSTKLLKYVRIAHKKDVRLLLLGEYILNPFFHELQKMSVSMIKEQTKQQLFILKDLAKTYNITIVAPLIQVKKKELYKVTAKVSPTSVGYYTQQLLINYPHWDEEKFFSNPVTTITQPYTFKIGNIKFAIVNGFEIHFDQIFSKLQNKKVDCILLPGVATFESFQRWKTIVQARSFTHNCYILRANRIGEYIQNDDYRWSFYGDSFLSSPNGEILSHLKNKEELMMVELKHNEVKNAKKTWGFTEAIEKRKNSI